MVKVKRLTSSCVTLKNKGYISENYARIKRLSNDSQMAIVARHVAPMHPLTRHVEDEEKEGMGARWGFSPTNVMLRYGAAEGW